MTLHIRSMTDITPERVRDLVLENLKALIGDGYMFVEDMPGNDERCVLVSDTHDELTLLGIDGMDSERAMLSGLARIDELGSQLARMFEPEQRAPVRLLVLSPEPPPGLKLFENGCPVRWKRIQVLSVNGELGLLFEPVDDQPVAETSVIESAAAESAHREPAFTEEEAEHFSQL